MVAGQGGGACWSACQRAVAFRDQRRGNVARTVVMGFENSGHITRASDGSSREYLIPHLLIVFEAAGIEFTDGDVPGVRLRAPGE